MILKEVKLKIKDKLTLAILERENHLQKQKLWDLDL